MAATKRNAAFFVYRFDDADGKAAYIGKGSGRRLHAQAHRFKLQGYEVARFWREKDAYAFERAAISEHKPSLNRSTGGEGSRAKRARGGRRANWEIVMDRIGSRAYSARLLCAMPDRLVSKVDKIRLREIGWPCPDQKLADV